MSSAPFPDVDEALGKRWTKLSRWGFGAAMALSVLTLIGLVAGLRPLTVGPGVEDVRPIQAASAIGLGLVALAGLVGSRIVRRWSSGVTLAIGVGTLGVYWAGQGTRVSDWLTPDAGLSTDPYRGLPASNSAFVLVLLAAASLAMTFPLRRVATTATVVATAISGTVMLGYLYGDRNLASFPFSASEMAVPEALGGALLGASMLLAQAPRSPLSSAGPGGMLVRRFVPVALLLPPVLFSFVEAQARFDLPNVLAGSATALTVVLVAAFFVTARRLDALHAGRAVAVAHATRARRALTQRAPVVDRMRGALGSVVADRFEGAQVATVHRPAHGYLAGDSFGVRALDERRLAVVLVDVAGHGAEPALLSLRLRDSLLQALVCDLRPAEAVASVQWLFDEGTEMASAIVAVVDVGAGWCEFASAGHPPPIHRAGTTASTVGGQGGPVLARMVKGPWPTSTVPLEPGDRIIFYTDGVADVFPTDGVGSGHERLAQVVASCSGDGAAIAARCVTGAAHDGADDAAVVVVSMDGDPDRPSVRHTEATS